jgi:hypothetical protein
MKTVQVLAVCAATALWSGLAWADAVPPEPEDCLDGTRGSTCHGGPYCAPDSCTQDTDCTGGEVCRDRQLCLGSIDCTGGFTDPDAGPFLSDQITGACEGGAGCDAPAVCTTMKVCVAPGGSTGSGPGAGSGDGNGDMAVSGCGCSIPGAGGGIAAGMAALALGGALLSARRRRRR